MPNNINTVNDFLIGTNGQSLGAMLPVHITSREQGLRTAAWIALMSESLPSENTTNPDGNKVTFEEVMEAVMNT